MTTRACRQTSCPSSYRPIPMTIASTCSLPDLAQTASVCTSSATTSLWETPMINTYGHSMTALCARRTRQRTDVICDRYSLAVTWVGIVQGLSRCTVSATPDSDVCVVIALRISERPHALTLYSIVCRRTSSLRALRRPSQSSMSVCLVQKTD